jgi:putative tricarboxylic transport membrane protein
MKRSGFVSLLATAALASPMVHAQGWTPQRNVELVIPVGPGGAIDQVGRELQKVWTELKLVPVASSVVNKAGAGHVIAYNYMNQKAGDPHIVSITSSNLISNGLTGLMPTTYEDYSPIAMLVSGSYYGLAVKPDSPIKSAKELLEMLRKNPGALSVGIGSALGASQHIALGQLMQPAGVDVSKMKIVSFTDAAASSMAVLGGHIDVGIVTVINSVPLIESGKLRLLATTAPKRGSGVLAQVPTWRDMGYKVTVGSWRGLLGTKGMTPPQVAYWEGVARKVAENESFRKFAEGAQLEVDFEGAADFRKFLETEHSQVKGVIAFLGMAKK